MKTKKFNLSGFASHLHYKDRPISYSSETRLALSYIIFFSLTTWLEKGTCLDVLLSLIGIFYKDRALP